MSVVSNHIDCVTDTYVLYELERSSTTGIIIILYYNNSIAFYAQKRKLFEFEGVLWFWSYDLPNFIAT